MKKENKTTYVIDEYEHIEDKSFSELFNRLLKRLNENEGLDLKKTDIAKKLGIGSESFRKIINKQQETAKRDCIIAICAVLGATAKEAI